MPTLLTEKQAIEVLQISRTTFRRLEREYNLRSVRGYLPSELERFVFLAPRLEVAEHEEVRES